MIFFVALARQQGGNDRRRTAHRQGALECLAANADNQIGALAGRLNVICFAYPGNFPTGAVQHFAEG
jgi:hypothetical protein